MKRLEWLEAANYGVLHAGIGPRTYRTYPVRAGENIKDIISKRDITRVEVDQLNPEVNLDKLTGASLLESPNLQIKRTIHPAATVLLPVRNEARRCHETLSRAIAAEIGRAVSACL